MHHLKVTDALQRSQRRKGTVTKAENHCDQDFSTSERGLFSLLNQDHAGNTL